jgi:hypothetical protein
VFFDRVRHNGIYIGHGKFVHASSGEGRVGVAHLDQDWFRQRWSGGRRIRTLASSGDGVAPQTVATAREAVGSED